MCFYYTNGYYERHLFQLIQSNLGYKANIKYWSHLCFFFPWRNTDMGYALLHSNKYNHIEYECIALMNQTLKRKENPKELWPLEYLYYICIKSLICKDTILSYPMNIPYFFADDLF